MAESHVAMLREIGDLPPEMARVRAAELRRVLATQGTEVSVEDVLSLAETVKVFTVEEIITACKRLFGEKDA